MHVGWPWACTPQHDYSGVIRLFILSRVQQGLGILYLDDSPTALREVERELTAMGHTVRVASTVAEATWLVSGSQLVIIDFHMPEMDGARALVELQNAKNAGPRPAFYLYTTDTSVAGRYKEFGFDGALTWKGNLEALGPQIQSIARILRMRKFMNSKRA
jgi:CheY-like chemotaxis protein